MDFTVSLLTFPSSTSGPLDKRVRPGTRYVRGLGRGEDRWESNRCNRRGSGGRVGSLIGLDESKMVVVGSD